MGAKILLVDDNKSRRDSLRSILMSNAEFAVEAADCSSALSLLGTASFDLILLDITLPDRSGFQVLEFLSENHLAGKVIVITGTVELENEIKSTTPGAGDYITKPYNPIYLLMSIEHVLSDKYPTGLRLQIIKAGDFIKSTPTGDLDLKASTKGLAQIADAGYDLHDYTVLIDLRDVVSRLSTADIFDLAFGLTKYGETFRRKTAVLARADSDLKQAGLFEDVAQKQGFSVRAFTVFEDAMFWLSNITLITEDH
jgi:DNA-binding response OmpR family regulator